MHTELCRPTIRSYALPHAAIKRIKLTFEDAVRATLRVSAGPADFTVTGNVMRFKALSIKPVTVACV